MIPIVDKLFSIGEKLIDKLIPDPAAKAAALLELEKLKQSGELGAMAHEKDMYGLEVDDRKSAREREQVTGDHTTRYLAYITLFGFFGVLGFQFYLVTQGIVIPEAALRTLDITTGILFAMVLAVKDYYFGSSHGSKGKDESIKSMASRS